MERCYYFRANSNGKNTDEKIRSKIYHYVRYHSAKQLGIDESDEEFDVSEHGKPYIKNYCSKLQFNISHSEGEGIVIFSDQEVGCDIEKIAFPEYQIATRCFHPLERELIAKIKNLNKRQDVFYEIWTQKEAYTKWLGLGLRKSFSSFSVYDDRFVKNCYTIHQNGFVISVYSEKISFPIEIVEMNWS